MSEAGVSSSFTGTQARDLAQSSSTANGGSRFTDLRGSERMLDMSAAALHDGDLRLSQSVLRALLLLGAFPADGATQSLAVVADEIGMARSTAHRYISTWVAAGVMEREPGTRRYRRIPSR